MDYQEPRNENNGIFFKTFSFIGVFTCLVALVAYIAYDGLIGRLPVCEEGKLNLRKEIKYWLRGEIARRLAEFREFKSPVIARNFASAAEGATIVESSDTWDRRTAKLCFHLIPVPGRAPPPITVLEPTKDIGECWPMKGSKGYLLIHLAADTFVEAFTVEHIPKFLHLAGYASEAPKNFSVFGMDKNGSKHFFGSYFYDINGHSFQSFPVRNFANRSFWLIELAILSNHGQRVTTCLYRFMVHGRMNDEQCIQ